MSKKLSVIISTFIIAVIACSCSQSDRIERDTSLKSLLVGDYSFTVGYDDPLCLSSSSNIAASENGYYFTDMNFHYLYYFDKTSKRTVPVCNMPNCTHDDENCNAYIDDIRHHPGLWYFDGHIYLVGKKDGVMGLYRINKDGTDHTRSCDFASIGPQSTLTLTVHRGYAYFSVEEQDENDKIFRVKLDDNSKPEVVYETPNKDEAIHDIRGYGDRLILYSYRYDKETDTNKHKLSYYDFSSENVTDITPDGFTYAIYAIAENCIIYNSACNVLKYDAEKDEVSVFYDKGCCDISYDGNYVYLDNITGILNEVADEFDFSNRVIKVMDLSGNQIDEIPADTKDLNMSYFGDKDYLLLDFTKKYDAPINRTIEQGNKLQVLTADSMTVLSAYDKSQIGTDKHEWIVLKEWDIDSIVG
ncbi:MAG: hypothetical protein K6F76_07530 [Clostridiales bacterium]|nr:hypothetical protein [Clostridiales bacterium]